MVEAQSKTPVFINTEDLQKLIESGTDLKILHAGQNFDDATEGDTILNFHNKHIPGAHFYDLRYQRDLTNPTPYMLPNAKHFTDSAKLFGIKNSTRVVVYDGKPGQGYWATRVYWMFHIFGHTNISILNGGLKKWVDEGRAVEATPNVGTVDDYKYEVNMDLYRTYEQIVQLNQEISEKKTDTQLLDARPEAMYQNGHIEQAKSFFYKKLLNDDETLKSPEEIKKIFEENEVDTSKPIVTSCGMGMSATYVYSVLEHIGASGHVVVYDGSYTEYAAKQKEAQEKKE